MTNVGLVNWKVRYMNQLFADSNKVKGNGTELQLYFSWCMLNESLWAAICKLNIFRSILCRFALFMICEVKLKQFTLLVLNFAGL